MKITEVDALPITDAMPPDGKRVRAHAPKLIASVINETNALVSVASIKELRTEHLQALSGGVDAATYLVNIPHEQVIIKLSTHGLDAEAETIEAWRKRHVRTPKVIKTGIVPRTRHNKQPIKYLVQQAMLDNEGRLIETCASYLVRAPHQARSVGRKLGHELGKIHSCVTRRRFGEFKDASGDRKSYTTWNAYMVEALRGQMKYLLQLGASEEVIEKVLTVFKTQHYIKKGRYLHGDFSIRNAAVKSYDPLKVSLFDPNPVIGDPSWDISFLRNNYEFEKRRLAYDESQRDLYVRNQQLWIGFKQGYSRMIHEDNLRTAQLIQAIYQAQYTEGIGDKVGFRVRSEFILDTLKQLASLADGR